MLVHGFTILQMVELVRAGLATATAESVMAAGRKAEVARDHEAERRALVAKLVARFNQFERI
jgi:hypothetical protein